MPPPSKTRKAPLRDGARQRAPGRSGGRAGGAGYDYQDIYVALQLAKLLMGDRDPLLEVMWEKKGLDEGAATGAEPVYVDDAIVRLRSGRCVYVQLKESAPGSTWTLNAFAKSGTARQFWLQWNAKEPTDRAKTTLRLASASDLTPLRLLIDVALRSRTPAELLGDDSSEEAIQDLKSLAAALSLSPDNPDLLAFVKSLQAERLPDADELEGLVIRSLSPFGSEANAIARSLVRIVARSKHAGHSARASLNQTGLIEALREDGVSADTLIGGGVLRSGRIHDVAFWDKYRAEVVRSFRTFRVYGLNVERAVFADLPSLFVPLRLAAISERRQQRENDKPKQRERPSLSSTVLGELERNDGDEQDRPGSIELAAVLGEKTRFGLIGGPGSGKTTTLKWLALVSALPGEQGSELRKRYGLPSEPLLPVFVRFRSLADRIQARGLDGVAGRVELVAEFLAAELESGLAGHVPSKTEALEMAEELLASDRCIFLFDALDEVPNPGTRARLFAAVSDLLHRYPNPRVVMSSRPYAFQDERAPIELQLYEPLPLNRAAQRLFCHQWYRAVRTHLGDGLTEIAAEGRAEDLARAAESLPDLSENPLLLSILALVHFNRHGLPVERSTLYDQATLAMLGHWDRDPAGRDLSQSVTAESSAYFRLHEASIRRIVEHLACEVQRRDDGGGEFSESIAIDALAQGLETTASVPGEQATERAESLLRMLADRAGIIQERSPGIFGFVHLSFQDYLAARWFVGAGEPGLSELVGLAGEQRYAEVVRFAVAILAADQRAEADDRALRLVQQVATKDALLAAACLLEAPRLQPGEDALEQLARRVWSECSSMWRRHHHPIVASRLTWTVLERSRNADRLLLEFLTRDSHGNRRPMEGEMAMSLLVGRPAIPMGEAVTWVIRQLARHTPSKSWMPLWAIGALLLVESGAANAEDHLAALVRLLGDDHWGQPGRGALSDRAERILTSLAGGPVRDAVSAALSAAIGSASDNDSRTAYGAARMLLALDLSTDPTVAGVLVEKGLEHAYKHADTTRVLRGLLEKPTQRDVVVDALGEA